MITLNFQGGRRSAKPTTVDKVADLVAGHKLKISDDTSLGWASMNNPLAINWSDEYINATGPEEPLHLRHKYPSSKARKGDSQLPENLQLTLTSPQRPLKTIRDIAAAVEQTPRPSITLEKLGLGNVFIEEFPYHRGYLVHKVGNKGASPWEGDGTETIAHASPDGNGDIAKPLAQAFRTIL